MLFSAGLVVAFDASGISALSVSQGLRGPRLGARVDAALSPGALVPQLAEDNLARPDEVRAALETVHREIGGNGRRACLVLPDGVARIALVEAPGGVAPLEYARFRLGQSLPFPPSEALVDGLRSGRERVLAAAVRRRVVRGYEEAAAAAGFTQQRVELAPLAAIAALLPRTPAGRSVFAVLGDAAFCLAAFAAGALVAFRNRRRDADDEEPARLALEIDRTAALAFEGEPERILVVGVGARRLVSGLRALGRPAEPGWDGSNGEACESAWLGAALP